MWNDSGSKGIMIGLLELVLLLPIGIQKSNAGSCWDYGGCQSLGSAWAVGSWYNYYSSGYCPNCSPPNYASDFAVYTAQSGSYSGNYIADYVLTATVNGYAPQIAIQIPPPGVYPYSPCLNDQIWYLGYSSPLFNSCKDSGALNPNSLNIIETAITYSNQYAAYFVNWYLNGNWYNSWSVGQSYFDPEMNPSFVIESSDPNSGDFGSSFGWISGYFVLDHLQSCCGGYYLDPNYFYGGEWCTVQGGCFSQDME